MSQLVSRAELLKPPALTMENILAAISLRCHSLPRFDDSAAWQQLVPFKFVPRSFEQPAMLASAMLTIAQGATIKLHMLLTTPDLKHKSAKKLMSRGAQLSPWDVSTGRTAAEYAVLTGDKTKLHNMLQLGLSPNVVGDRGETLLHAIFQAGWSYNDGSARRYLSMMELLLQAGADPAAMTSPARQNVAMLAVLASARSHGHGSPMLLSTIMKLLDAGVDLDATNFEGQTLVHLATITHNVPLLRGLLARYPSTGAAAAAVARADRYGRTPLHLASQDRAAPIAKAAFHGNNRVITQLFQGWPNECETKIDAVLRPVWSTVQQRILSERARRESILSGPAVAKLRRLERAWRRRKIPLQDLRHAVEAALPDDHTDWFFAMMYADIASELEFGKGGGNEVAAALLHELELYAGVHPLALDPMFGQAGFSAKDIRHAHATCGYTGVILKQLLSALIRPPFKVIDSSRRAVLDARDSLGQTALHAAAEVDATDAVALLLSSGADAEIVTLSGLLALDMAEASGATSSAQLLNAREVEAPSLHLDDPCTESASCNLPVQVAPEAESGGWRTESETSEVAQLAVAGCHDVDFRPSMKWPEFLSEYVSKKRPLLLNASLEGSAAELRWSRESLLSHYGDSIVNVGAIPYAAKFGFRHAERNARLEEFVQNEMGDAKRDAEWRLGMHRPYVFASSDTLDASIGRDTGSFVVLNKSESRIENFQWYIGPRGSGAPLHFHGNALNYLAYGQKFWVLVPPENATYMRQSLSTWLHENSSLPWSTVGGVPVLRCVQDAGSTLYVPAGWGHGVINTQESVGFAKEFIVTRAA